MRLRTAALALLAAACSAPVAPPPSEVRAALGTRTGNLVTFADATSLAAGDHEWGVADLPGGPPFVERVACNDGPPNQLPTVLSGAPARADLGLVRRGRRLFTVGGTADGVSPRPEVEATDASGFFFPAGALTVPRMRHATFVHGDFLYAFGGTGPGGIEDSFERARLSADGATLDPFVLTTGVFGGVTPRTDFAFAVVGGFLHLIGGRDAGGNALGDVISAPFLPGGALGAFAVTGSLPQPLAGARAAVHDGAVYVVGGRIASTPGAPGPDRVAAAVPDGEGRFGTALSSGPIVGARDRPAVAVASGQLLVFAGGFVFGATPATYTAPIIGRGLLGAAQSDGSQLDLAGMAALSDGAAVVVIGALPGGVLPLQRLFDQTPTGGVFAFGACARGRWSAVVDLGRAAQVAFLTVGGLVSGLGRISVGYRLAPTLAAFDPWVLPTPVLPGSGARAVSTASSRQVSRAVEVAVELDDSASFASQVLSALSAVTVHLAPTRLAFSAPPPADLPAGACTAVTVATLDDDGGALGVPAGTRVDLAASGGDLRLRVDPSCLTTLTSVFVASGESAATFYVQGGAAGPAALSATPSDLTILPAPEALTTVVPGPAARAELRLDPPAGGPLTAGVPFAVPVRVLDGGGNLTAGQVTLSLAEAPPGAALLGATGAAVDATGLGTVAGVRLERAGTYRLSAEAGGGATASGPFAVGPAAPAALQFLAPFPTDAQVGAPISPQVKVALLDPFANLTASGAAVTLSVPTAPGVLSGASVTAAAGVAAFGSLTVNAAGTFRLQAASAGLPAVLAPGTLDVFEPGSLGTPTQLAWTAHPAELAEGACSPAFRVEARDAAGARVSLLPAAFIDALLTSDGGVAFFADAACTAPATQVTVGAAGVATFWARASRVGAARVRVGATLPGGPTVIVWDLEVRPADAAPVKRPTPLNGWSCGTGGGGAGALLVAALALLAARRRGGRLAGLLLLLAAATPARAQEPSQGPPAKRTRASTSTPTPTPTATAPVPLPPPPTPRRSRDTRPSIAVLDVQVTGQSRTDTAALTDVLAASLDGPGWFRLVTSRDVAAVLAFERKRELLGCSADQACLAELAGALGVDHVASLALGQLGGRWVLTGRLLEVRRGAALARASLEADDDGLAEATREVARQLLEGYRATRPAAEQERLALGGGGRGLSAFALRVAAVGALAPSASEGARRAVGAEGGLSWRFRAAWDLTATGVAGPAVGARLAVVRSLLERPLRLGVGLRGAAWPGPGAYGGGPVLEVGVPLGPRWSLLGFGAAEAYAGPRASGRYALVGGLGASLRL